MQKCANCGTILDDSKVVCYMCGASLVEKDEEILDNFDMSLNDLTKENSQSFDFENNADNMGSGLNTLNSNSQKDNNYSEIESLDETGFDSINNNHNLVDFDQKNSVVSEVEQPNSLDNNQLNIYDTINQNKQDGSYNDSLVSFSQDEKNINDVGQTNNLSDNQFNSYDNVNSFNQGNQFSSYDNDMVNLVQYESKIDDVGQTNNLSDNQFNSYDNVNNFNQGNQFSNYENNVNSFEQNNNVYNNVNYGDNFTFFNNQNTNNSSVSNSFYYETQKNNNMQTWDENVAYNSYSAKKSSSALIFNFISLAVFLGVLVFVYFKFIKKDVNYVQFNNLSYNEPSSFNKKRDGKNISYSKKNCIIKLNYENSGVDSQYITKYFDGIIESKSKEKNLSFQFIDLKINSNLWTGLNVILVDDKNLNSLKEKERYISILYSGNVYNISYYNNSFSEECTNDFDEMLGSLEFTNKK